MPRLPLPLPSCCLFSMCVLLAGCESSTVKPVETSASRLGHASKTDDPSSDVLPPQSEPPVTDQATGPVADPDEKSSEVEPEMAAEKTQVLFDGKSLDHWKVSNFGGEGAVDLVDGAIIMQRGSDLTGIHWDGDPLPRINYEVTLEAQRIDGSDFFCGIVFPVSDEFCSFVAGGWGGSTVGLSSVDGMYAAENETGTYAMFEDKTWYKFRLRVSEHAITAWINGKRHVHLKTMGRKLTVHPAVDSSKPFGISCYATVAGLKDIKVRDLTDEEIAADAPEEK